MMMKKQKAEKPKKQKIVYIDDGRTIANMDVEGLRWHGRRAYRAKREELQELKITRGERRAILKAAVITMLPVLGVLVATMILLFILLYFWLG